jgi:hypothetical protein
MSKAFSLFRSPPFRPISHLHRLQVPVHKPSAKKSCNVNSSLSATFRQTKKKFRYTLARMRGLSTFAPGEMAEWSIAAVLKTVEG